MPRAVLGISRVKIGEELEIGERGQARGVIGKLIARSGDVVLQRHVSMETLVHRALAKEGGGRGCGGDRPLAIPEQRRQIIRSRSQGALARIPTLCGDIVVQKGTNELQFRVVEFAVRVGRGCELRRDCR